MRKDESDAWHKGVRDAAQAREVKAKQLAEAVAQQASSPPGGAGSIDAQADAWVGHGAQQMAGTLPRHDHIVLMAVTHPGSLKTGVASVVHCDTMTAVLALGRLVGQVNEALRRDHVNIQVELRTRPIRGAHDTECVPRGLQE